MKRREFFKVLGGGIVVLLVDDSDAQEAGGGARRGTNEPAPAALSAWLHSGEDGRITLYTGKVGVGQNPANPDGRRQMDDRIGPACHFGHAGRFKHVAMNEPQPRIAHHAGKIADRPRAEVVQHGNEVPVRDELLDQMRPDEAGSACNQISHVPP